MPFDSQATNPTNPIRQLAVKVGEASRTAFENAHPHIPYDLTIEEAERGSVGADGKFRLCPADVAARAA